MTREPCHAAFQALSCHVWLTKRIQLADCQVVVQAALALEHVHKKLEAAADTHQMGLMSDGLQSTAACPSASPCWRNPDQAATIQAQPAPPVRAADRGQLQAVPANLAEPSHLEVPQGGYQRGGLCHPRSPARGVGPDHQWLPPDSQRRLQCAALPGP